MPVVLTSEKVLGLEGSITFKKLLSDANSLKTIACLSGRRQSHLVVIILDTRIIGLLESMHDPAPTFCTDN